MKKKIFSLITIFILSFTLAFSFFDKVSFAADTVTYTVETSDGRHGSFEVPSGFTPFIVNGHFSDRGGDFYCNILVASPGNTVLNKTGFLKPSSNTDYPALRYSGLADVTCTYSLLEGRNNITYSISPSVPVISKEASNKTEIFSFAASLVKDPSQIPINVTTYDSSLGSLQLQDNTSWRFLRYEPFWTGNTAEKKAGYSYKVKLRTIFKDTTSTGQKYDKIQIMVRIKNIRSRWAWITTHPWKDKLPDGEEFSYYLTDLKSPTTVDLQIFDYKKDENGNVTELLYPIFQPAFEKLGIKKPAISEEYWFFCDYTVCYRPVTSDGKFGDWWYLTPENPFFGNNMLGGGKSISAVTGTASSVDDPNSTSFNPLPENSTSSRTATGNGETLGDAINDSNNSLIGGTITSGGSLSSNITDLFSFFTDLPSIISTIFSWLPPWVLSLFGIGFALFVPIFIYKFVRG